MITCPCHLEEEIVLAASRHELTDSQRAHMVSCTNCRNAVQFATLIMADRNKSLAELELLPSGEAIWLKGSYQSHSRLSRRRHWVTAFASLVGIVSALGTFRMLTPIHTSLSFKPIVDSLPTVNLWQSPLFVIVVGLTLILFIEFAPRRHSRSR